MKNHILFLLFLIPFSIIAQTEDQNSEKKETEQENPPYKRDIAKNEVSLNVFNIVIAGAFDARYERILSENTSLGFDVFVKFVDDEDDDNFDTSEIYSKDFSFTGRFKYFFGDRTAWGFYTQGFLMASSGMYDNDDGYYDGASGIYYEEGEQEYFDVALGFGVGGKFVSKDGFFTDLSIGLGRNFFNSESPEIVGLLNVDLGFRF
ncbi:MAG TPA: hypothetical protein VFM65_05940 [Flavobacteriaceae bacterium]|nr:hypothetical protein [Flavobacteriaceae bacterium]